jgi:hypothetical protein
MNSDIDQWYDCIDNRYRKNLRTSFPTVVILTLESSCFWWATQGHHGPLVLTALNIRQRYRLWVLEKIRIFLINLSFLYNQKNFDIHCYAPGCPSVPIKLVRPSQVQLLVGFQPKFTEVISNSPSCAHHRHILLCYTKRPPDLKNRKIFSGLHRSNY